MLPRRAGASIGAVGLVLTISLAFGLSVGVRGKDSSVVLGAPASPLASNIGSAARITNYFVVIVMEEKNHGDVNGNFSSAPYNNRLANDYAVREGPQPTYQSYGQDPAYATTTSQPQVSTNYSFLKTLEAVWHLPALTRAAETAAAMTNSFTTNSQLSFNPTAPIAQQNITFTGTVTQGLAPFNYAWTFGDGGTATGGTVVHSYSQTGWYEVTLTTTDALNHTSLSSAILHVSVESQLPSLSGLVDMVSAGFLLITLGPIAFRWIRASKRKVEN